MTRKNIIGGVAVLTIAGIICKVLGAFVKIPLTNILTSEGIGIYQLIFPLYSLLLLVSSSGIPIAISKIISEKNNAEYSKYVVKYALKFVLILSIVLCAFIMLFSSAIATLQGNNNASWAYIAISPAVIFVAVISVIRGYFQGVQNFTPTAISQIIEQVFKVCISLFFAYILTPISIKWGVVGAVIGITLSELISMLYLILIYKKKVPKQTYNTININKSLIRKTLLKTALPITLTSVVMPLLSLIDSVMFMQGLKNLSFSTSVSTSLYGIDSGVVSALLNLPLVVSASIASTILPLISSNTNSEKNCALAFKVILFIMIPLVSFYIFFSKQILQFLFANALQSTTYNLFGFAENLLKITSITILYASIMQISASILQAKNYLWTPLIVYAVSGILKIILNAVLLNFRNTAIYSIGISSVIMYLISAIILLIIVKKEISFNLSFLKHILYPMILITIISIIFSPIINSINSTFGSLIFGAVIYLISVWVCLLLLNFFEKDELPKFRFKNKLFVHN